MVSFHLYNTTNIENIGLNGAIYNHIKILKVVDTNTVVVVDTA